MSQLGDALLTTTQRKVLGLLYGQPQKSFYTKEILRLTGMGVATIKRELDRMRAAGLLTMTRIGNQHHYQANPECPIFNELVSIIRKISGEQKGEIMQSDQERLVIGGTIVISRAELQELAQRYHIHRLVLFGSAARGELRPDSDIDLLVEFEGGAAPSLGGMVELEDAFVKLFGGRKVDVATRTILNNPYRQRAIEKDMEELYAA